MLLIPLKPVANQTTTTILGGQVVRIAVRQMTTGVYLTAWKDNEVIQSGILCVDRVRMLDSNYDGFIGGFMFIDSQGLENPDYTGIGSRWNLFYLEAGE
jgi:hypothetical protein